MVSDSFSLKKYWHCRVHIFSVKFGSLGILMLPSHFLSSKASIFQVIISVGEAGPSKEMGCALVLDRQVIAVASGL